MVMEVLSVRYDSHEVGAVSFDTELGLGAFEYSPDFLASGLELSPIHMPLAKKIYQFPGLPELTFRGLPGMIADALPDDFGNAVLNAWIASQGRRPQDISPLQRLQYTGSRGMGALEFHPATAMKGFSAEESIQIESLVAVAQEVLDQRENFNVSLGVTNSADQDAMLALLSVGTSAGGARPKAVLAFNQNFTMVRSGQAMLPEGFTHYIMKFDGVTEHSAGRETFGDPMGYGAMEYTYYQMAKDCGITMMPCRLLEEGSRRHFLTQRFDRKGNTRYHVQTLTGMAHVDYKAPGSYSYEEVFAVARQLKLPASDAEQILRRLIFNIVARNHDDHAKNIAFIMQPDGRWALSPAYDLAYSYKPGSKWVASHWMSLNGKRDGFTREDIYTLRTISPRFTERHLDSVIDNVIDSVARWSELARENAVPKSLISEVSNHLRLDW